MPNTSNTKLPMAYPSGKRELPNSGIILAADVGGTKTNLALFEIKNGKMTFLKKEEYLTTDHNSFLKSIRNFHHNIDTIDSACFGVAGVINNNKVKGVNFAWEIDAKKLESSLNINRISLINDLQANAYGLSALEDNEYEVLAVGKKSPGNAAIISPGTGLGEAGLFWDGLHYHPYATEGGHCSFSPHSQLDIKLWEFLNSQFGHVSWERLISGQGIYNIYQFLRVHRNHKEPEWLTLQIQNEDPPVAISMAAARKKDPVCTETLQLFLKYLSIESAQLALKTKATGGIYIGGGIVPKILGLIDKEEFYRYFISAGRMEDLLKSIPVKIVLNDKTALMGAAYYAAMGI